MFGNKKICRVLVVEDNPADLRLLQEAFRDLDVSHKIFPVQDGEDALDFLYRRNKHSDKPRPDLILLDINLPKVDGHKVLETLKSEPDLKRIPVIMLTNSGSDSDVLKAYDHHANAYIQKPTDMSDFFTIVQRVEHFWLNAVKLPQASA